VGAKKAVAAYFSGTGGTERAAKRLCKALVSRGMETELMEIRRGGDLPDGKEDLLVLLFAVHAANAPEPVHEWLKALKTVQGTPAAVISVSAGGEVTPNKACRVYSIRSLEKKGYKVAYEDTVVMPSNVFTPTPEDVSLLLFQALPRKAGAIAEDLLAGRVKRARPDILNRFLSFIMEAEKIGVRRIGKKYRVSGQCNGCGLCAGKCPANNIAMENGRPVYGRQCTLCMGCMYNCPKKAISLSAYKRFAIKDFDLDALEKKACTAHPPDFTEMPDSILWEGVRKYLEQDACK